MHSYNDVSSASAELLSDADKLVVRMLWFTSAVVTVCCRKTV